MMIGQQVRRNQRRVIEKVNALRESARLPLQLLKVGQVKRLRLDGLQPQCLRTFSSGLAVMPAAFRVFWIEDTAPPEPGMHAGLLHGLVLGVS